MNQRGTTSAPRTAPPASPSVYVMKGPRSGSPSGGSRRWSPLTNPPPFRSPDRDSPVMAEHVGQRGTTSGAFGPPRCSPRLNTVSNNQHARSTGGIPPWGIPTLDRVDRPTPISFPRSQFPADAGARGPTRNNVGGLRPPPVFPSFYNNGIREKAAPKSLPQFRRPRPVSADLPALTSGWTRREPPPPNRKRWARSRPKPPG